MLYEELLGMSKFTSWVSEINSQIDTIIIKMDTVEVVVPKFSTIALMILAVILVNWILFVS